MNPRTHYQHEEEIAVAGRNYQYLFRREIDSGYRVTCAELPPVLAFGETLDKARIATQEEIGAWIEMAEVRGDYITRFR